MDDILNVSVKIVLAILVGGLVGWERASKRHSAGLRTFMVVTLSTAIVMMLELYLHDKFGASIYILSAAAIIAVSSVAVNSIFFSAKNQIKGLTTSATLWACGVIGLIIGASYYLVAALALAGLYLTISVMPTLEEYLKNRCNHFEVQAELNSATNLPDFVATVRELGIRIDEIELNPAYVNSGISVYSVALTIVSGELKKYKTHKEIIEALKSLEYIRYIEEMN